jgi:hypothetical protein
MTKVELAHHPIMIGTPTHAPSSAGSQRAGGTRSSPTPIRRATRWTNGGRTNYAENRDIWFARRRARLLSSHRHPWEAKVEDDGMIFLPDTIRIEKIGDGNPPP